MKLVKLGKTVIEIPVTGSMIGFGGDSVVLDHSDVKGLATASDEQLRAWVNNLAPRISSLGVEIGHTRTARFPRMTTLADEHLRR